MEDEKLCPFHKDADGNFKACYGAECMAYAEYYSVSATVNECCISESQKYSMCRMFTPVVQNYGCV